MRKCKSSWLETYCEYSRFQQAPARFHVWTGVSLLASVANRKIFMDRAFYTIFPNMYICMVGPTGITKTTATDMGMELLETIPNMTIIKGKATSFYLYDLLGKRAASSQDCVVTIYSQELKNLLEGVSKTELITMLTELFGCPANSSYYTKTGGQLKLRNVCFNILASSTPEWLTVGTTLDEISGGFTGRFVYVYANDERSVAFPEDFVTQDVAALKQDLIDDLRHIATLAGQFTITNQAKAEYIAWYNNRRVEWTDERLIGYYARKGDLVFKLSMLLALSGGDALVIDESILKVAWEMLKKIEVEMGEAFSGVVADPVLRYKDAVLSQIVRSPGQRTTRADILKKNWNRFDGIVLDRIINNLAEARMITHKHEQGQVWYTVSNTQP